MALTTAPSIAANQRDITGLLNPSALLRILDDAHPQLF